MQSTRVRLALLAGLPLRVLLALSFMLAFSLLVATGHVKLVLVAALMVFGIPLALAAPRAARLLVFAALPLALILSVVPAAKPMSHNYLVYAILLSVGVVVAVRFAHRRRLTAMEFFFTYLLASAVIFIGVSEISSMYQTFLIPLAAFSYYELALTAQRRELRIVLMGFLIFTGIEATLGVMQSLFNWPLLFFQQTMSSPRNPLSILLSSISPSARQGLGTFPHYNVLGSLLVLSFPIAFVLVMRRRCSVARWAYFVLIGAGVFTTYSRQALLGSMVGIAAILVATGSWWRKVGIVGITALFAASLLIFDSSAVTNYYNESNTLTSRVATWSVAADDMRRQPQNMVFGLGYSYYNETSNTALTPGSQALSFVHSWLLQTLLELGVVGLVLLLASVLPPLFRTFRRGEVTVEIGLAGAVLGFFVAELVDNNLWFIPGVFMFLLLGVLQRMRELEPAAARSAALPDPSLAMLSR